MKQNRKRIFITAAVCLLFIVGQGYCLEYRFGAEIFDGLFKEDNFLDEDSGTFDYDETYNILGIYPEGAIDFNGNFSGYAMGEFEWFHSWDAADQNDIEATLADAFLSYSKAGFYADVGLQQYFVGNGMVLYSHEPGIALRYEGWKNTYIRGELFRIFDNSPVAAMAFGYSPGFLESVEVIGAWYHDADDRIADLYGSFYEEADLESTGHLFWVGGQADMFIRDVFVSCLMLHQFGSLEIDGVAGGYDSDLSAYLIDLEMNYNLSSQLSAAAFVFTASGDTSPQSGNLHAFISPMPFNRRTTIFFNGGFERYDIEESVELGGVTWEGVIAPGMKVEYQPNLKIVTELLAALLFPQGALFDTDDWYGWEADARMSYEFYPDQRLFAEAGVFAHGNYFNQKYGFRPDPATRIVAGISMFF